MGLAILLLVFGVVVVVIPFLSQGHIDIPSTVLMIFNRREKKKKKKHVIKGKRDKSQVLLLAPENKSASPCFLTYHFLVRFKVIVMRNLHRLHCG